MNYELFTKLKEERLPFNMSAIIYTVEYVASKQFRHKWTIPEFQRKYLWDEIRASRYIEGLMLGLPLSSLLAVRINQMNEIFDGSNRIRTLWKFFDNEITLKGCDIIPELNGLDYNKMDSKLKTILEENQICINIINVQDKLIDNSLIMKIFERINECTPITSYELEKSKSYFNNK